MSVIEIKSKLLTVGISTHGAELMYINGESGRQYLWNGDKSVWCYRAPILFPICGGLKNDEYTYRGKTYALPKHGFASESEFTGIRHSDTKAEFVLEADESTLKSFPFRFRLRVIFELVGQDLNIKNVVENLNDDTMYFSIGAHEGYLCEEGIEDYEIIFESDQSLKSFILNGNLLENKYVEMTNNSKSLALKYDYFKVDALVFKNIDFNKVALAHRDGQRILELEFDKAKYFLLWTKPGAKYICLEPWCGIQDIVGSDYDITKKEGIISLPKGATYSFVHTVRCVGE